MKTKLAPLTLMVFFLSVPFILAQGSPLCMAAHTTSSTGHVFTQVTDRPELGDAAEC
jgi:hypothetical protein